MSERNVNRAPELSVEIKKFSYEAKAALEQQGFMIYDLTGQSINSLKDAGRQFWSTWHKDLADLEALGSMHSEVAINPNEPFLPRSNYKTLTQQKELVEEFSQKLEEKIKGVKAIIGQIPDYAELALVHFDTTRKDLFGSKHSYDYARTKTPTTSSSYTAIVGRFIDNRLRIAYWNADDGHDGLHVAPLIMPA